MWRNDGTKNTHLNPHTLFFFFLAFDDEILFVKIDPATYEKSITWMASCPSTEAAATPAAPSVCACRSWR
jgi:hypothetical protein